MIQSNDLNESTLGWLLQLMSVAQRNRPMTMLSFTVQSIGLLVEFMA